MTTKKIYNFHPDTGEFINEAEADESPLEPGVFLVPANATDIEPPTYGAGQRAVFSGGNWKVEAIELPPIDAIKARQWSLIKTKRDAIKAGGVKVGTKWYHSDETSRTQYIGLLRMADASVAAGGTGSTTLQYGGQDIQWKTMDGTFIKMTVQRANDVFNAVSGLDFAAFGAAEAHKAAMEASADPASYDFAAGWPATFGG